MINIARIFLIMLNNPQQMRLKLLQEEKLKQEQKQLVIWLVTQLLIKSQKFQKISQQNKSETVTNENDKEIPKEIPKERYMSSEKRQEIIVELRLVK